MIPNHAADPGRQHALRRVGLFEIEYTVVWTSAAAEQKILASALLQNSDNVPLEHRVGTKRQGFPLGPAKERVAELPVVQYQFTGNDLRPSHRIEKVELA